LSKLKGALKAHFRNSNVAYMRFIFVSLGLKYPKYNDTLMVQGIPSYTLQSSVGNPLTIHRLLLVLP